MPIRHRNIEVALDPAAGPAAGMLNFNSLHSPAYHEYFHPMFRVNDSIPTEYNVNSMKSSAHSDPLDAIFWHVNDTLPDYDSKDTQPSAVDNYAVYLQFFPDSIVKKIALWIDTPDRGYCGLLVIFTTYPFRSMTCTVTEELQRPSSMNGCRLLGWLRQSSLTAENASHWWPTECASITADDDLEAVFWRMVENLELEGIFTWPTPAVDGEDC